MKSSSKNHANFFKTIVSVCFCLCAFVFPVSVYAMGELWAWGENQTGGCNVPEPNTGFTVLSSGGAHQACVKSDGSIAAWGDNLWGECNVPEPNTDFKAVASGNYNSAGVKADGSVVVWGINPWGQCNVPSPNTNFTAVAMGNGHVLGLKNDGSIAAWGDNGSGQCNVPSPNTNFIAVAANGYHSLGLKQDGSIVCWGNNLKGQNNVPSPNTGFTAIAAGWDHSLGLKQDGSIVAWGSNVTYEGQYAGQCVVPSPNTGFTAIAAGWSHSLGLKQDGSIVAWGYNHLGQCNVPPPNTGFTAIAAGGGHSSLGLKKNGNVKPTCVEQISGDLNGDCKVDLEDFAIMASHWLQRGNVRIADVNLNTNPNWTTEGQWQFGTPTGTGGSSHGYPDPNQGCTGQNVYGVNLNGDYTVTAGGPYRLTAGPFDCSGYEQVSLNFARWLNTDNSDYVKCTIEVSNNGSDWQTIWVNPSDNEIADNQWQQQHFDISSIADRKATVYVRWSYQILNSRAFPYSGWNIDNMELVGLSN
jgi:hypothetical protein